MLARLNQVSTAKRTASMAMGDEGFGERKKRNQDKALESEGSKKNKKKRKTKEAEGAVQSF